jgi:outer membrane protein TolC
MLMMLTASVGILESQVDDRRAPAIHLTFDTVVEKAVSSSAAVSILRDTWEEQVAELGFMGHIQDIGISIGGNVSGSPPVPFAGDGSAEISTNVDLIPQLSVNGSLTATYIDTDLTQPETQLPDPTNPSLTGAMGLEFTPLADKTGRPRDLLEIERTEVELEAAVHFTSFSAISLLLDAVLSKRQTQLAEMEYSVAEQVLSTTQLLYEKDQATENAYTAAKNAFRSKGHDLLFSRLASERALENLSHAIAVPVDHVSIPTHDQLDLSEILNQAVAFLVSPDIEKLANGSSVVRLASLDVREAEIDFSAARLFSPTFTVTASTALPEVSYTIGAQFGFSVSSFDFEAREDARKNVTYAGDAYENALSLAHFDTREAILTLTFSLEELEAAREALESSRLDLSETQFFVKRGEATDLDLAQSELDVSTAELNVTVAEANVATSWFVIEFSQF